MRIAVLIPCFNEETTIAKVTAGLSERPYPTQTSISTQQSTYLTVQRASAAGAVVRRHPLKAKVTSSGACLPTSKPTSTSSSTGMTPMTLPPRLNLWRSLLDDKLDFVNAARVCDDAFAYRPGHRFGNAAFTRLSCLIFGRAFTDILSGYKVLSRRFVKTFPAMSGGFEIETRARRACARAGRACAERQVPYRERPQGSVSKLRTFRDGFHILMLVSRLVKDERPLQFFGMIGTFSAPSA